MKKLGPNFIQRDFQRSESDDFKVRVSPLIGKWDGAVPQHSNSGELVGWIIKPLYE